MSLRSPGPFLALYRPKCVPRQGFGNQWQLKLNECLAHLVGLIMRRGSRIAYTVGIKKSYLHE